MTNGCRAKALAVKLLDNPDLTAHAQFQLQMLSSQHNHVPDPVSVVVAKGKTGSFTKSVIFCKVARVQNKSSVMTDLFSK